MNNYIRLFLLALVFAVVSFVPAHAATFLETGGIVVIEAESSSAKGSWSKESKIGGAKGGSYLIWKGPDLFSGKAAGRDTLRYTFRVQQAGNYELKWRTYIGHANTSTEANDSWVRFPSGKNINGQHALNGWTKVFQNQPKQWSWSAKTVDHVGKSVRQYFSKGDHVIEVSGRSNGHAIDRIVMFRYDKVSFSGSKFDGLKASSTVGGSQDPDIDTDKDTDTDTDTDADKDADKDADTDKDPEPEPAKVASPDVSVAGALLSWSKVDALSINVHNGNGEWLESLAGSSTQWLAPSAGDYYLVATNTESWENWGRSNTVTVSPQAFEPALADGATVLQDFSAEVYSSSAIELFWTTASSDNVYRFMVERNGVEVFNGSASSYFDSGLSPATEYTYTLKVVDQDVVEQRDIKLTTRDGNNAGADAAGSDALSTPLVTGLRGDVYSQTALEIYWDRSTSDQVVAYNVYLDEALVSSSDAMSFFIDGLNPGQTYLFGVAATDANANESPINSIYLSTHTADGASLAEFGRPNVFRSVTEKQQWESLPDSTAQLLPTDCLLGTGENGIVYCYSTRDNRLLARRIDNGESQWSFRLVTEQDVVGLTVSGDAVTLNTADAQCDNCNNATTMNLNGTTILFRRR